MAKTKDLIEEAKKTQFTRIGLSFAGISINDATAELIWRTLQKMDEMNGEFSVHDGVKLEYFIREKYKIKEPKWNAKKA